MPNLSADQQYTILENGPNFDRIEDALPEALREELIAFQRRVGNAWADEGPDALRPPTVEETQELLGRCYLSLDDAEDRARLRIILGHLGFDPPARGPKTGKSK